MHWRRKYSDGGRRTSGMETDRRIEDGDVDPLAVEVDEARGGVEAAGARGVSREGALGAEGQEERVPHRDPVAHDLAGVAVLVERGRGARPRYASSTYSAHP